MGCGLGKWVYFFHINGYDIEGIDWDEKIANIIKKYYPELKVTVGEEILDYPPIVMT